MPRYPVNRKVSASELTDEIQLKQMQYKTIMYLGLIMAVITFFIFMFLVLRQHEADKNARILACLQSGQSWVLADSRWSIQFECKKVN